MGLPGHFISAEPASIGAGSTAGPAGSSMATAIRAAIPSPCAAAHAHRLGAVKDLFPNPYLLQLGTSRNACGSRRRRGDRMCQTQLIQKVVRLRDPRARDVAGEFNVSSERAGLRAMP